MKILKTIGFWFASCTWGIIMTLLGAIGAWVLILMGYKPKLFHWYVYFEVGESWGGCNFGAFFFVSKNSSDSIKRHESGHGLQNIMLGVFMPFLVCIPSAIRYWYREYLVKSGKKTYADLPDYDSIWFEGWATALGDKYFKEEN